MASENTNSSRRVPFAIIGVGGIAQSQHLPNLLRVPQIDLQVACDMQADRLRQVADKYSIPRRVGDAREVFADPTIEGVIVATRDDFQAPLTIAALDAGKHVYVEKPLATTPEQCDPVVQAQRRSGKHVAVGFNRRFAPAYCQAREVITGNGGAHNIHYRIADSYCRTWGAGSPPGQRILHEVCHIFDILRWFTGSEVDWIHCLRGRHDDEICLLRFASGCIASITSSGYATVDMPKEALEIISDYGGINVIDFVELRTFGQRAYQSVYSYPGHIHPDHEYIYRHMYAQLGAPALYALRRTAWEIREGLAPAEPADRAVFEKHHRSHMPDSNYTGDKGWVQAMAHFAQSIAADTKPLNASPADALAAAQLGQAAITSRESNQIVPIRS